MAQTIATLPIRMGGLGMKSAEKMAPAAYWAWADAMPMLEQRPPQIMADVSNCRDCDGVFRRVANECGTSGPRRVCGKARLVRLEEKCPTPRSTICRTWRVATWLAVPRVFLFRRPYVRKTVVLAQSSTADRLIYGLTPAPKF